MDAKDRTGFWKIRLQLSLPLHSSLQAQVWTDEAFEKQIRLVALRNLTVSLLFRRVVGRRALNTAAPLTDKRAGADNAFSNASVPIQALVWRIFAVLGAVQKTKKEQPGSVSWASLSNFKTLFAAVGKDHLDSNFLKRCRKQIVQRSTTPERRSAGSFFSKTVLACAFRRSSYVMLWLLRRWRPAAKNSLQAHTDLRAVLQCLADLEIKAASADMSWSMGETKKRVTG